MNEKQPIPDDEVERLVRDHLQREEQAVNAGAVLAGVRSRLAAQIVATVPSPTRPSRVRRWAGRAALAMAASILVAILWALPVATPQASAETLVRQLQQVHARPVELCYSREESNPPALDDKLLPPLPVEARIWTRGDRFFMETVLPNGRTSTWGRDAEGRVWFAPQPRVGFQFEAHDVPLGLARMCDMRSMNLDTLLSQVLANFDLQRKDAGSGLQVVEARPRPEQQFLPIRFVRLEIDSQKKILRKLEMHRRHPEGMARAVFSLQERASPRPDTHYTLKGHLADDAKIYSLDDPPPVRLKLLRKHYEMGRRNGP